MLTIGEFVWSTNSFFIYNLRNADVSIRLKFENGKN